MNYKFKAVSKKTNCLVYGFYVKGSSERHFICNPYTPDVEIDFKTLCQFIGLEDKNGNEIYTGDVLCDYRLDGTYRMFKIFNKKGGFVFNTHQDDFKKPVDKILFTEACADMQNASFLETCEIEGNFIFSPELYTDSIV